MPYRQIGETIGQSDRMILSWANGNWAPSAQQMTELPQLTAEAADKAVSD